MAEPNRTRLIHEQAIYMRQYVDRTLSSIAHQHYSQNQYAWQPPQHIQAATPYVNTNASIQKSYLMPPYPSQVQIPPPHIAPPPENNPHSSLVSEMSRGSGTFMGGLHETASQSRRHNQGGHGNH